jgi:hypothetical protein
MQRIEYVDRNERSKRRNWLSGILHARVGMSLIGVLGVHRALRYPQVFEHR